MVENKSFEKINFNELEMEDEYNECVFLSCDFSRKVINTVLFENCIFKECNLGLAKFSSTNLREVTFEDCKMTGTSFAGIGKFSNTLVFKKSYLNYVNFVGVSLRSTQFIDCNLNEAYFDEADIAFSIFDKCDLARASFFKTNLQEVDFSTAFNFTINPEINKLKKTIFSEQDLRGLVAHLDILIRE